MTTNIGIIGAGHMGYLHFLSCLKLKNYCAIKGVADKSNRIRKKISGFNVNTYDDYKEMIEKEDLDGVIISLPNFLKRDCIEFSSKNNLSIFVDKPIARNYSETKEIFNIINRNNTKLMVGTNYRYHPNIKKIDQELGHGKIGDIKIASYELIMNGPLSHPRTPRPMADWYVDSEKAGGGAVLDLAYHLLDLNHWWFGDSTLKFSKYDNIMNLPVEDSATIITESNEGSIRSVFNVGWFSKVIFPEFNFRVNLHGSNGFLSSEKIAPSNLYAHAVKEAIKNFFKKITLQQIDYLSYTYYYSSFFDIIRDFITKLEDGQDFPNKIDEHLAIMKIIDEVYGRKNNV